MTGWGQLRPGRTAPADPLDRLLGISSSSLRELYEFISGMRARGPSSEADLRSRCSRDESAMFA